MRFGPRRVPAANALAWLREGVALSARAPLGFVALGLAPAALLALPGRLGDAGFAALPLVIAFGVAMAARVDAGEPWWRARLAPAACARLAGFGAVVGLLAWALVAALAASAPPGAAGTPWPVPAAAPNAVNAALATGARALWFWTLVLGPTLWFAPPLAGLAGLGAASVAVQAVQGFALNRFLLVVWGVAVAAQWLATLVPVLGVPAVALLSATLYTGYRDVWLGRAGNAPDRTSVRGPARAGAPA